MAGYFTDDDSDELTVDPTFTNLLDIDSTLLKAMLRPGNVFTNAIDNSNLYLGYRMIACDGSDLNISRNPKDKATYFQLFPTDKGFFNQLHLNAFYDLKNLTYTDAVVQNEKEKNEFFAYAQMIYRSSIVEKVILVADRGYEKL